MSAEDEAQFRALLRGTSEDLLAYFERRLRNREDAADMLADTLLQAWRRNASAPASTERQRMWLFTIAANVLANHHRGTRRSAALASRLRQHLASGPMPDHGEGYDVRDAVLRLRDAQRELVILIHWDGFSIVEAAEILGLNTSTARSRYASAREELKKALTANACT